MEQGSERFIHAHISRYGLNGSNTLKNPSQGLPQCELPVPELTEGQWFCFGYNGELFNWRASSTCMFWAQYDTGRVPLDDEHNSSLNLAEALSIAFDRTLGTSKKLSIGYQGTEYSALLVALASRAHKSDGREFEVFLPVVTDRPDIQLHEEFKERYAGTSILECMRPVSFAWTDFESFLNRLAQDVRCVDATLGLSLFLSTFSKSESHLFESHWPRIIDQNFDRVAARTVGPPHWCFEDGEREMVIARELQRAGRRGALGLFRYSPVVLRALFESEGWKSWLRSASASSIETPPEDKSDGKPEERSATSAIIGLAEEALGVSLQPVRSASVLLDELKRREVSLVKQVPKGAEIFVTPLARVLEDFGIRYDFSFSAQEETYGRVF